MALRTSLLGFTTALLTLGMLMPGAGHAEDKEDLAPYKMLRSLQFIQDTVVAGDHSAAEMQKFLLAKIDGSFRAADPAVFDDPRNVDAALIYAMSGGNPATLEFLVSRDVDGHFDNRVTDALRKYLSGKGALVAKTLAEMAPEYRDAKIGPYLALVSANTAVSGNPEEALKFYDQARLAAPGTIVEEAALRRSVSIATSGAMVEKGLAYSSRYARRFLHSPYASQFADLFVTLAVDNYGTVKDEDIEAILSFMDNDRQREVYLRIARRAAIAGKNDLARMASERAGALPLPPGRDPVSQVSLYTGLANISSADVTEAMENIDGIPDGALSPRDQALRTAARQIAEEVLRAPDKNSLAQETPSTVVGADHASSDSAPAEHASADKHGSEDESAYRSNVAFEDFMTTGRSKLEQIDSLLGKESNKR